MNIVKWDRLSTQVKKSLLQRPMQKNQDQLQEKVKDIIHAVKEKGDRALLDFTVQFDNVALSSLQVSAQEFANARSKIDQQDLQAIRLAIARIRVYQQSQIPENQRFVDQDGIILERQVRPIARVGLYVPAGTAPLVSTVMMLAVPAQVAGCSLRILCTPPDKNGGVSPAILVAAEECGIQAVYKVGGAQAIAAMAYGTQTIPPVDKILGPGNQWVTLAKMLCAQFSDVSIDMPAGPSEIMVIADETADPTLVAADLLSQAEHDVNSQVILVTPNATVAQKVNEEIQKQLARLPRKAIAAGALENSLSIIVTSLTQAVEICNEYGPEHVSLQVTSPEQYIPAIQCAGTVFLGKWTTQALGDYMTGANHVLPTGGYVRSLSGLSVLDFLKWVGFQTVSKQGLNAIGPAAMRLAYLEQLMAHANAIDYRLK